MSTRKDSCKKAEKHIIDSICKICPCDYCLDNGERHKSGKCYEPCEHCGK
jgi:hypothetical protein